MVVNNDFLIFKNLIEMKFVDGFLSFFFDFDGTDVEIGNFFLIKKGNFIFLRFFIFKKSFGFLLTRFSV